MAIDWKSPEKDEFYPPCYYPGTVDRNKAKKVHFDKAKSIEKVDICLQRKGEFILEGIVTDDSTGNPIPKTLVTVHYRDMLFDRVTAYTDDMGYYRIESLGAGEFIVHVDAEHSGFVRKRKPITIDEAVKINHLHFALKPGVTIRGKFVDENGEMTVADALINIALMVERVETAFLAGAKVIMKKSIWTFQAQVHLLSKA